MIQIAGLIRETFLEAVSKKVVLGFLVISALVLLGLALYFFHPDVAASIARMQPTPDDPQGVALREMVHSSQLAIGQVFYIAAVFLSIFITAGIVPSMMERGTIDLLLSKPVPRSTLLLGKVLGGLLVATACIAFFILCSWLIISPATGLWNPGYLASLVPIVFAFVSLYSVLVFIGVTTQSPALGMIVCYLLASVVSVVLFSREEFLFQFVRSDLWRSMISLAYYVLPQINDLGQMSADLIQEKTIDNWYPLINTGGFAALFFGLSVLFFRRKEF